MIMKVGFVITTNYLLSTRAYYFLFFIDTFFWHCLFTYKYNKYLFETFSYIIIMFLKILNRNFTKLIYLPTLMCHLDNVLLLILFSLFNKMSCKYILAISDKILCKIERKLICKFFHRIDKFFKHLLNMLTKFILLYESNLNHFSYNLNKEHKKQ